MSAETAGSVSATREPSMAAAGKSGMAATTAAVATAMLCPRGDGQQKKERRNRDRATHTRTIIRP